jgi:hypothetical protein
MMQVQLRSCTGGAVKCLHGEGSGAGDGTPRTLAWRLEFSRSAQRRQPGKANVLKLLPWVGLDFANCILRGCINRQIVEFRNLVKPGQTRFPIDRDVLPKRKRTPGFVLHFAQ